MKINFKQAISLSATIASLLLSTLAPTALASDSITITGNGSGSFNDASLSSNTSNTVVQDNSASISNNVSSNQNTGGNVANGNTGGDVLVGTGNADQVVTIDNAANLNRASIDCGCQNGGTDVTVAGNGSLSSNFVNATSDKTNSLYQTNDAYFDNTVYTSGNTGNNDASGNTGNINGGSRFAILTGNATSDVGIRNAANANFASIGGSGSGTGSGSSIDIIGNGSGSFNSAFLSDSSSNTAVQDNNAYVSNYVNQDLNSGFNNANGNTGGSVLVGTGNVSSLAILDTRANFNAAHLDCGCFTGNFDGRIAGNGSSSDSFLTAFHDHSNTSYQTNYSYLDTYLTDSGDSGYNDTSGNTSGYLRNDPVRVLTGNTGSDSMVVNHANKNVYGSSFSIPGGWSLNLSWDWGNIWSM